MKNKKELKEKLLEQYLKRKEYNRQYQKERYVKISVNIKRQDIEYATKQMLSLYPSLQNQKDDIQEVIEKYLACLKLKDEIHKKIPQLTLSFEISYNTFMEEISKATKQPQAQAQKRNDTYTGIKV